MVIASVATNYKTNDSSNSGVAARLQMRFLRLFPYLRSYVDIITFLTPQTLRLHSPCMRAAYWPYFIRFAFKKLICEGPVRQQPPIIDADDSHSDTTAGDKKALEESPLHILVFPS